MYLNKLGIIRMLKETGYIKNENDIAEIKIDDGNIYIKLNQAMQTAEITIEVE